MPLQSEARPADTTTVRVAAATKEGAIHDSIAPALLLLLGDSSPAVKLTGPAGGTSFTSPANIMLRADVSDADSGISKVEFFEGASKLGEISQPGPYDFAWSVNTPGIYALTARATNKEGATAMSASVTITVTAPATPPVTHTVSGTVVFHGEPLQGVLISGTNGASCSGTNASGQYSCTVPQGWSGTIAPSSSTYGLSPTSRSYGNVGANQTGENYLGGPRLANGIKGTLELVASDTVNLPRVDGLAFDRFGNLFAVLEVVGPAGGAVYINKQTGAVTPIALNIPGACQFDIHPNGDLYVSSELPIRLINGVLVQFGGLYRVAVTYDGNNRPVSGAGVRLATVLDNPEGVQALHADGAYGNAGQMFIAEDKLGGRIVRINPDGSGLTELVGSSANLNKPEGLAFGDFAGARMPALFGAEKAGGRVFEIVANGTVTTFGDPAAIGGLNGPDNIEFGPDGHLYVGEKLGGRIVRIAADGTHSVLVTGLSNVEGLAFDPLTGDLYLTEIELSNVWRVRF